MSDYNKYFPNTDCSGAGLMAQANKPMTGKPHPGLSDEKWIRALELAEKMGTRPEIFCPLHRGFVSPSPDEVYTVFKWTDYKTQDIARLLGVNDKMPRRWMNNKNPDQYRPIVPAYWFYFLALFDLVPVEPVSD